MLDAIHTQVMQQAAVIPGPASGRCYTAAMKVSERSKAWLACLACAALLSGCGSQTVCPGPTLSVSPTTATADHISAPPGNQQQFHAYSGPGAAVSGCAQAQVIAELTPQWTVSDTVHVTISSAQNTNGLATCLGSTTGAATVIASIVGTSGSVTKLTASLTCK